MCPCRTFRSVLILLWMLFYTGIHGIAQSDQQFITICWDVSQSMVQRNLEKDMGFLGQIFEHYPESEVQLLLFGTTIEERDFTIREGNWKELKEALVITNYDGIAIYRGLSERIRHSQVYMFTDGNAVIDADISGLPKGSFIVVSSPQRNTRFLRQTALLHRSRLVDFNGLRAATTKEILKKDATEKLSVSGRVKFGDTPLEGILVYTRKTGNWATTDPNGMYNLSGAPNEEVVIRLANGTEFNAGIIEGPEHPTTFIDPSAVALDEVVLTESRLLEEVNLVQTAIGLKDKNTLGYAISSIDESDISEVEIYADEALGTKVPGVKMSGRNGWGDVRAKAGFSRVEIRGRNTINLNPYALIVVDGIPVARSIGGNNLDGNTPQITQGFDFIDPSNIKSIAVLKGLAATNFYGSEGANGVIVITTKTGSSRGTVKKLSREINPTTQTYQEETEKDLKGQKSSFMHALVQASNPEAAYSHYMNWRELRGKDPLYYLKAYEYFAIRDKQKAFRVLSNLAEQHINQLEYLQIVAMGASVLGLPQWAEWMNLKILEIAGDNPLTLLNLAVSLREQGKARNAFATLSKLETLREPGMDFPEMFQKALSREWMELIRSYREELSGLEIPPKYENSVSLDARLFFEWNKANSPIRLRFVHPNKHYFEWNSQEASEMAMNIGEFEVYGEGSRGQWLIHSRTEGLVNQKHKNVPLVLRAKLVLHFGTPNQQAINKLIYFPTPDTYVNVLRFRL